MQQIAALNKSLALTYFFVTERAYLGYDSPKKERENLHKSKTKENAQVHALFHLHIKPVYYCGRDNCENNIRDAILTCWKCQQKILRRLWAQMLVIHTCGENSKS